MSRKAGIIRGISSIVLGILMIVGFIYLGKKNYKTDDVSSKNIADEYSEVSKNNVFVYKNKEEVLELLKNGSGVVLFGFSSCPWCQAYAPILNEVAVSRNFKNIYYYDIKEDRENNTEFYKTVVNILKSYLNTDDGGNYRIYVPEVVFVNDGKIVAHDNETSMMSGHDTKVYWNDENVNKLKTKLNNYFNMIVSTCESCN